MKRLVICILTPAMLVLALTGCAEKGKPNTDFSTPSATITEYVPTYPENGVGTAYPDKAVGFQLELPAAGEKIAVVHTSKGDISLRFFPEAAPKAVQNFLTHAENGYYNGVPFYRVVNGSLIQGGDPNADGTGGESIYGAPFEDEFDSKLLHLRGAVAMATAGPDQNGSQFFINQAPADAFRGKAAYESNALAFLQQSDKNLQYYKQLYGTYKQQYGSSFTAEYPTEQSFLDQNWYLAPYPELVPNEVWELYEQVGGNIGFDAAFRKNGGYTVFAQVFDGMDIVDAIASVKVSELDGETPTEDVLVTGITVTIYQPEV